MFGYATECLLGGLEDDEDGGNTTGIDEVEEEE